ncbi:InlB B-repeat-containing protein [Tannockella kyphosi]|uniref:InlB B-repeat-containing protein n=1 Tax=Tannockella kyphosi TaxID=2899121 RepID=UPI0024B36825|nr:InlB B-repeat-containing protein [Tannockella kyphosi]
MKKQFLALLTILIVIGAGVGVYFFSNSTSTNNDSQESYRTIKVLEYDGTATIDREDIGEISIYDGMQLVSGDKITVDQDSYVRLVLDEDKYIYIEANTVLSIVASGDEENSQTEIIVETGSIVNELTAALSDESTYEVTTPNASMSVRGTVFGIDVYMEDGLYYTDLLTFEGTVASYLKKDDGTLEQEVFVEAGYSVKVESEEAVYVEYVLTPIGEEELWEIELDAISDSMLSLLQKQTSTGEKETIFAVEEVEQEQENRLVVSYDLTTVVFEQQTSYVYNENEELSITTPTATGYTFEGWYSDNEYQTSIELNTMPSEDIVVYAKFEKINYTVNLKDEETTSSLSLNYQDTLELPTPTKEGYTFDGWYSNDTQWKTGDTMPASNLSLTSSYTINSYVLSLDGETQDVDYGTTLTLPTLAKEGYTFNGWYDSNDNQYTTMPSSNVTLTSSWTINSYVLSLDGETQDVDYGTTLTLPSLTKEGYTFNGWYSGDVKWETGDTMPASNLSLTSSWTINSYQLNVISNFGSNAFNSVGNFDYASSLTTTIESYADSHGNSYAYANWYYIEGYYTDVDCTEAIDIKDLTMPEGGIVIFVNWKRVEFTLTLINGESEEITKVAYNETLELEVLEKEGYTFNGWCDSNDNQYTTMPAKDLTLTATFTINEYEVTVVNVLDGKEDENTSSKDMTYGSLISDYVGTVATLYEKTYVTFQSYYYYVGETKTTIDDLSEVTVPVDGITVYIVWTTNSYTLILVDQDEEKTESKVVYGTELSLSDLSDAKEGYEFNGWYSGDVEWETGDTMPASDLTLTATFTINEYEVTVVNVLDGTKDENTSSTNMTYGTTISDYVGTVATLYEKTYVTFQSYYYYVGETKTTIDDISKVTVPEGGITVCIVWTTKSYTLTLVDQNEEKTESKVVYGTELSLSDLSDAKEGYTFNGWCDEDKDKWQTGDTMPASDLTLTAKFTINEYEVTVVNVLDGTKDENTSSTNMTYGTTISDYVGTVATLYEKTYVTFQSYYYYVGETKTTIDDLSEVTVPEGGITVYIVWTTNSYRLALVEQDDNGTKTTETTVVYGTELSLSDLSDAKEGYEFNGWCDEDKDKWQTGDTMPAKDLTLTATFTINEYEVTLYDTDNKVIDTLSVTYGESVVTAILADDSIANEIEKTNYKFVGWYYDAEYANSLLVDDTMPAKGVELYGKWEQTYALTYYFTEKQSGTIYLIEGESFPESITTGIENSTTTNTTNDITTTIEYVFGGWKDDDGTVYTTMPASDLTVTAIWSRLYTITFVSEYADTAEYDYKYLAGETYELLPVLSNYIDTTGDPENTYVFVGWYDASGDQHKIGTVMGNEDVTLYAYYVASASPVYMYDGSDVLDIVYVETGEVVADKLTTPTKTGYTFVGWYFDEDCTDEEELSTWKKESGVSLNVYAKWQANTYYINYVDDDDGTIIDTAGNYTYSDTLEVELNSSWYSNGYVLSKWYNPATGITYSRGDKVLISELVEGAVLQEDGRWLITLETTWSWHLW